MRHRATRCTLLTSSDGEMSPRMFRVGLFARKVATDLFDFSSTMVQLFTTMRRA